MRDAGRIVLLNGPSSFGKTSIGKAMLPLLEEPWFFVPVDSVSGLRSTVHQRQLDYSAVSEMLHRTRLGYHRVVRALASVGNHVLMDYPLSEPWRLTDLLSVLAAFDVTLVEVVCSPEELSRRERLRGDRPVGLAASQRVCDHDEQDLTVDSTNSSPEECAAYIVDRLDKVPSPKAFDRLRRQRTR